MLVNIISNFGPGYWTTYGVENEPRRLQLLSGGALLISHFRIYDFCPDEVPVINNNRGKDLLNRTLLFESNAQEAPEFPPPMSRELTPPRPRPPVAREAIHLIADAPSPRLSSMTRFSRERALRREVNVISKLARSKLERSMNQIDMET